ncbi:outer membrane protein assembly factor BamA [Treponema zioleckii]|uniref:outer membrane protein assembly factor BamA n=1 Tax=Treponema zioleckii TaxID=331680 RepID=UPI00168AD92D|nr:outer membrane protein assembly factor BamA [Treponema zioleckii]
MKTLRCAFLCLFCVFSAALTAPVFAQEEAETSKTAEADDSSWFYGKIIKSVTFKGLKSVDSRDVDGVTSGFIGKNFSDDIFSEMLDRIYALDLFDDIVPEALPGDAKKSTVAIVFNVKERPVIYKIVISGNSQIRTAEIKEAISVKEKDIYIANKVLIDERAIRDLYLGKGFTDIKVSSKTKTTEKGIEVTFSISEGNSTVIKTIEFVGNKTVTAKKLKKFLSLKEQGLFNKGAFQESQLEADKQKIVAYYQTIGYVDASVIDVNIATSVNTEKSRKELTITFVLQEGSVYTFGGISFNGNQIFSDEKLSSLMKLKVGDTFNQSKFQEGWGAIMDLYYENGYTSNRFQPVPNKDTEKNIISYTCLITENVRSHVEHITIKGNTKTKEDVIRREIPIESGDIFSKNKITNGLRNLYNLQYFSAVVPDVIQGSEENLVDLVFTVEEQSTTSVELGVTFSGVSDPDDLPFALYAKWSNSNIGGTGRSVGVSSTIATDEQSIDLSYSQNWFMGLPITSSISTSFSHANLSALRLQIDGDGNIDSDSYYMDYEQYKWSLSFAVGHRWTPDWAILSLSTGVTGSLKNNIYDEDILIPLDTSVSEYANTWGWQNSIFLHYSMDGRNINYDPSAGWFASQRLTWYGLTPFESEFFLRTDTKLEKYFTLCDLPVTEGWNFKLVLMGYSGLSMLFPAPDTGIGESSQLYIDGMFNARGWTSIYNKKRGKAMWSNIVELRMPLVPGVLAVDWFADAAVIKDTPEALFAGIDKTDVFFSTGPGIRFAIPQFPLRLLFANTGKFGSTDSSDKYGAGDGEWHWDKNWKFVLSFNIANK